MKLYNAGSIIAGLILFVGLMAFPLWFNAGSAAYKQPELKLPTDAQIRAAGYDPAEVKCIEDTETMRREHMVILNEWRDWALRDGERTYVNSQGVAFTISLQNTCMKCHTSKEDFCDKCHNSAAVSPYCWDCHLPPEGVK